MAQQHVYHWKHGWIPLDHYAALQKAKGNQSAARKYADRYGLPATFANRDQAETALGRSLPAGYSVHYSPAKAGAIGATSGYRVTTPNGEASLKLGSPADVRAFVLAHSTKVPAPRASERKPWSLPEANRQFMANQATEDAKASRGTISDAQVALIEKLLVTKIRSGTGDGFMRGPRTRKDILGLSRQEASAYINSLRGDY